MQVLQGPNKGVRCLAFSPDGRSLVAGCYDGSVRHWDLSTGAGGRRASGGKTPMFVLWGAGGTVVAGSRSRIVCLGTDGPPRTLFENYQGVAQGCLSADGQTLFVSTTNAIRRWQLADFAELPGWPAWSPGHLAASADGTLLASAHPAAPPLGGGTFHVALRDGGTGEERTRLTGFDGFFDGLAFSPDGTRLAVATHQAVWLWELPAGRAVGQHRSKKFFTGVAYAPDARFLATSGNDGFVRFWDGHSGDPLQAFDWQIGKVLCVAFAPEGLRLAAGGAEGKVVVWDVE